MDDFSKHEQKLKLQTSGISRKFWQRKRGAMSTGAVVLTVIAAVVVLAIIVGGVGLMWVFFRYDRNAERPTEYVTTTTETTEPESTNPAPSSTDKEETKGTKDKNTEETTSETSSQDNDFRTITDAATLPNSGNKKALSTVDIAKKVGPATVSIIAELPYSNNPFGQVDEEGNEIPAEATGSGFIVSKDGYIVTNNHVISGATAIKVDIPGEAEPVEAKLVGTDPSTDIAVLKIDKKDLPFVVLGDSDALQVGELAVAIGNPYGELAGTMTAGIISALDREINIDTSTYNLIQTDASINSGNSGGPLVNSYGEVVGVTNAKVSGGEGLGFAIPINDVKSIIEDLINDGYVKGRPEIGIGAQTIDEMTSEQFGWPIGAYVRQVNEGSSAEKAGIKVGDIITKINDTDITSVEDVNAVKNQFKVGDKLTFTVYRGGETLELDLTLQESKPAAN